jgi:hypothetical protein
MCHFINLVLPAQADVEVLQPIAKRYGRLLRPNAERRISRELTSDERAFFTNGNCDCGTMLAIKRGKNTADDGREVARRRGAGWSEARLQPPSATR